MKTFFTSVLFFLYGISYSQNDSTVIFIEKNGIFTSPIQLPKGFKLLGLLKNDTSQSKYYNEIKINWLKSPKTELTHAGFRIETSTIQGLFIIAINFDLPKHFYVNDNRAYLFECNNNYLYPGKTFILESYIHKWNGADYVDLSSSGIVSDSLTKIDIKARNKTIATITGAIPKVIIEGRFNGDGASDFVLAQGNSYKMYVSNNNSFKTIKCKFILADIVPEF